MQIYKKYNKFMKIITIENNKIMIFLNSNHDASMRNASHADYHNLISIRKPSRR